MGRVVSSAGAACVVSSVLRYLAGRTGSIRVRVGSGAAGTRSTGTVSAGTVVSGIYSTGRIPDATEAIRPSAVAATNTITTPSAVKKPSCSMIRM